MVAADAVSRKLPIFFTSQFVFISHHYTEQPPDKTAEEWQHSSDSKTDEDTCGKQLETITKAECLQNFKHYRTALNDMRGMKIHEKPNRAADHEQPKQDINDFRFHGKGFENCQLFSHLDFPPSDEVPDSYHHRKDFHNRIPARIPRAIIENAITFMYCSPRFRKDHEVDKAPNNKTY